MIAPRLALVLLLTSCAPRYAANELVWRSEVLACVERTADSVMTTTAAVRVCEVKLMGDDRWRR